jgi:hypothetical protein
MKGRAKCLRLPAPVSRSAAKPIISRRNVAGCRRSANRSSTTRHNSGKVQDDKTIHLGIGAARDLFGQLAQLRRIELARSLWPRAIVQAVRSFGL